MSKWLSFLRQRRNTYQYDTTKQNALIAAIQNNSIADIQRILTTFTAFDAHYGLWVIPFITAVENGDRDVMSAMCFPHFAVDFDVASAGGCTAFFVACEKGKQPIIEYLFGLRVNIHKPNHAEETPFFAACENDRLEAVQFLLKQEAQIGASLNKANNDGETPFFIACTNGCAEIVRLLIQRADINVNTPNNKGQTPFFAACESGNLEICNLLYNHERINKLAPDSEGKTPFFAACEAGKKDIIREFLADITFPALSSLTTRGTNRILPLTQILHQDVEPSVVKTIINQLLQLPNLPDIIADVYADTLTLAAKISSVRIFLVCAIQAKMTNKPVESLITHFPRHHEINAVALNAPENIKQILALFPFGSPQNGSQLNLNMNMS